MKVIFLKTKTVKDVSYGYAINYLLPQKIAVIATEARLQALKREEEKKIKEKSAANKELQNQAERLDGKVLEFKNKVTKKDLAEKLKVDKGIIDLKRSITKPGEYLIELDFGKAKAKIKVKVKP